MLTNIDNKSVYSIHLVIGVKMSGKLISDRYNLRNTNQPTCDKIIADIEKNTNITVAYCKQNETPEPRLKMIPHRAILWASNARLPLRWHPSDKKGA